MSPRGIADSLHQAALSVAKRQAGLAGFVFGMAKGAVGRGVALAESLRPGRPSATGTERVSDVEVSRPEPAPERASGPAPEPDPEPAPEPAPEPVPEPRVVLREPAPPLEPPVDIVEQVLAAEAREPESTGGRAGEPKGTSRQETHGETGLNRAEVEEIADEVAEASPQGSLDLETPVGTTGADTARNPATAEADLQQPGTEPIVDPSTTKAVAAEQETLRKASRGPKER